MGNCMTVTSDDKGTNNNLYGKDKKHHQTFDGEAILAKINIRDFFVAVFSLRGEEVLPLAVARSLVNVRIYKQLQYVSSQETKSHQDDSGDHADTDHADHLKLNKY